MHYSEIIFFGCFIAFIVGILLVDLLVIDKEAHEVSMKEAGIDIDIVEDGTTFEENALIKASEIAKIAHEMPEYKDMIKAAYDKGHTIGMHTYSHDYAKVYASVDAYFQDLDQIGQMVQEEIGYVPCFIRFPGGSSNTVSRNYMEGIMSVLVPKVLELGYQYYDWNGSSGDGAVRTTEQLVDQATSFQDNNIILLSHDSETKDTTVEALPKIIEYYQSQGYVFKALDLNSYVAHHGVNN